MSISNYLDQIKNISKKILDFLANESDSEEEYQNLFDFFDNQNIKKNKFLLKETLHLLSKIADNHHRLSNFNSKIEKILIYFAKEMNQYYANFDLFNIFKHNKRILLFLLENKLMKIEKPIGNVMKTKKYQNKNYPIYFFNEMKSFIDIEEKERIENKISSINENDPDTFKQRRKEGENDKYICQLIRNDSVEDFIIHVNKTNLSLSTKIDNSIFETNEFLLKNEFNLIEYAAFFGSIQIFKYLYMNKNELLTPDLWLYAIHGNNPELIHFLEENDVKPKDGTYKECFIESIKCHHVDVSNYLKDKYLYQMNHNENKFVHLNCFKYHNYVYFPKEINNNHLFDLCRYDYVTIVEFLLQNTKVIEPTITTILKQLFKFRKNLIYKKFNGISN